MIHAIFTDFIDTIMLSILIVVSYKTTYVIS